MTDADRAEKYSRAITARLVQFLDRVFEDMENGKEILERLQPLMTPEWYLDDILAVADAEQVDLRAEIERLRALNDFMGTEHMRLEEAYGVQADLLDEAVARAEADVPAAETEVGEWVHLTDGSVCSEQFPYGHRFSQRLTAEDGTPWWCTTHQSGLRWTSHIASDTP